MKLNILEQLKSFKLDKNFVRVKGKKKKFLVWHSHNFSLPYIAAEESFIISTKSIFNLYFLCFILDKLHAFKIIVYIF